MGLSCGPTGSGGLRVAVRDQKRNNLGKKSLPKKKKPPQKKKEKEKKKQPKPKKKQKTKRRKPTTTQKPQKTHPHNQHTNQKPTKKKKKKTNPNTKALNATPRSVDQSNIGDKKKTSTARCHTIHRATPRVVAASSTKKMDSRPKFQINIKPEKKKNTFTP